MKRLIYILLFVFPTALFGQLVSVDKLTPQTKSLLRSFKGNGENILFQQQRQKSFALSDINNKSFVHAFVLLEDQANPNILSDCGAKINSVVGNIVTVLIPVDSIELLAALPEVKRVDVGRSVDMKMDKARVVTKVDEVLKGSELSQPFKGKGVLMGFVDIGFQYGHINFFSPETNTSRVKCVWNQLDEKGPAPEGFYYGTELTGSKITRAGYDVTNETHGTHVVGIAAGSDMSASYYGVAPETDLALVSINSTMRNNVSILNGVKYLFDYAKSVDKPCVVNLSLGMHVGPHDGTSLFDKACDEMQGPGRLLVGAAGNEGVTELHITKRISPADTLKTFLSYSTDKLSSKSGYIDFWGEPDKAYKIRFFIYNKNTNKLIFNSDEIDVSKSNEKSYAFKNVYTDGAVGLVDIYTEKNPLNNKANAYIEAFFDGIADGNYVGFSLVGEDGVVHGWVDGYKIAFTDLSMPGYTDGDTNCTVNEIGGTGKKIISVGAYTTKNEITNISGIKVKENLKIDSIVDFSSRGPTTDERMKPEITAPGAAIISSFSDAAIKDEYYGYMAVDKITSGGKDYYYGGLAGTSMATPMVTGILATWLEAYPRLSPDDVRTVFQNTAVKDSYTGETDNNTWGYGKIDAWNGIKEVIKIRAAGIDDHTKTLRHIVRTVPGGINLCFGSEDIGVVISVYDIHGQKVYSSSVRNVWSSEEVYIDLSGLAKGIYFVSVQGNKQSCIERFVLK